MALTHKELCLLGYKFLKNNGFKVAFHDSFVAAIASGEQPDAIGFRSLTSCLIEAKCSRSDFLADKKKRFRQNPSLGMGDWRFFLCEQGLIKVEELPEGWGLLEVKGKRVYKTHGWPPNGIWVSHKPFQANKQAEVDYLYSACRRMEIRGYLEEIYDGYPKRG